MTAREPLKYVPVIPLLSNPERTLTVSLKLDSQVGKRHIHAGVDRVFLNEAAELWVVPPPTHVVETHCTAFPQQPLPGEPAAQVAE